MTDTFLTTIFIPAYSGNYTKNRAANGGKIEKITIHHMAGNLSVETLGAMWQKAGRSGSSHYGVRHHKIAQYVKEKDIAWTDGNWGSNRRSVTIETANNGGAPRWTVAQDTFDTLCRLVADIARRNRLGTLVPGKNLTWHSQYAATACPGPYLKDNMQRMANAANAINRPAAAPKVYTDADLKEGQTVRVSSAYKSSTDGAAKHLSASKLAHTSGVIGKKITAKGARNPYPILRGGTVIYYVNAGDVRAILSQPPTPPKAPPAAKYAVGTRVRVSSAYRTATDGINRHLPQSALAHTTGTIARIERHASGALKRNPYAIASPLDGKTIIYFVNDGDIRAVL